MKPFQSEHCMTLMIDSVRQKGANARRDHAQQRAYRLDELKCNKLLMQREDIVVVRLFQHGTVCIKARSVAQGKIQTLNTSQTTGPLRKWPLMR